MWVRPEDRFRERVSHMRDIRWKRIDIENRLIESRMRVTVFSHFDHTLKRELFSAKCSTANKPLLDLCYALTDSVAPINICHACVLVANPEIHQKQCVCVGLVQFMNLLMSTRFVPKLWSTVEIQLAEKIRTDEHETHFPSNNLSQCPVAKNSL